jgi:hypothetical protein
MSFGSSMRAFVRDITKDGDPLWALNSLRFVTRLKDASLAIAKAEGKS